MNVPTVADLSSIAPQIIVTAAGLLVLLLDTFLPRISKRLLANLAILGLILAGITTYVTWPQGAVTPTMQGLVLADHYTSFFNILFCGAAILAIFLSVEYLEREGENHGEYYALILFTTLGGMVMAASLNLICIFIGLEILSISLYILSGYETQRLESDEAGMKYFLLGAFASAFLLYGVALVYGATGSINIPGIAAALRSTAGVAGGAAPAENLLLLAGISFIVVGFGFKVAVVPFHVWTPDVYEGAPTSVTAFMSVTAKAAGFAAFLRLLVSGMPNADLAVKISAVLASIAALTMVVGNVVAVVQTGIKRMLAYSSIAHAGYILAAMVVAVRPGGGLGLPTSAQGVALSAVLFYLLAYTVSNLGAFAVLLALRKQGEELREIGDFAGVGRRYPLLAGLMALFMLSLAGLPPTAGFFGKLFIFQALVQMSPPLVWLIVLFALTSVVSFYYYLGVVRAMYMDPQPGTGQQPQLVGDLGVRLALAVTAVGTVLFGIWAQGGMQVANKVANAIFDLGPLALR